MGEDEEYFQEEQVVVVEVRTRTLIEGGVVVVVVVVEMVGDIAKTVLADSVTGNNPIAPNAGEVEAILNSRL